MPLPTERAWNRQLLSRFVTLWYLKAFGTMAFMVLFFQAYFWVLHHPMAEPLMMPTLAVDDWVPFLPEAFYAYVSLWVYVSLAPALLPNLRELLLLNGSKVSPDDLERLKSHPKLEAFSWVDETVSEARYGPVIKALNKPSASLQGAPQWFDERAAKRTD